MIFKIPLTTKIVRFFCTPISMAPRKSIVYFEESTSNIRIRIQAKTELSKTISFSNFFETKI
jgi:hypothetical protein